MFPFTILIFFYIIYINIEQIYNEVTNMEAPIYSRLKKYFDSDKISFAMPGHKNGRGLNGDLLCCDVTELDSTLNLFSDDETITQANSLLSAAYGSDKSYILTCGSTVGIQAMLAAVLSPGDTLLAASDCHMSVINTCAVCGYNLRLIPTSIDPDFFIPQQLADIERALNDLNDIRAVIVTSPTYYGICRDIERLADICHKRRIPLLVDEAHGAHFAASDRFPKNALRLGADACVNSAHKTLNALTGAAYLHVRSSLINRRRLNEAVRMFHTSSPSYVIAASADIARAELEMSGKWENLCDMCTGFRQRLEAVTYIRFLDNDDPTRLVLNFTAYDTTGFEVARQLSQKYGIDVEMADMVNIVLIATVSNTGDDFMTLFNALNDIVDSFSVRLKQIKFLQPPAQGTKIYPQKAFYSDSSQISLSAAAGRISASTVTAYPPGIPIICAGESISPQQIVYISYLKSIGASITGLEGDKIAVV